ncbi:hypothetical protein ACP70R_041587 [Stipagrostis hirtigluma subsp. patula]
MAAAASSSSTSGSPGGGPRPYRSRFGDTTLTKVFVGGLAWETPSEGLRQHFERYGDILEAVVITDRLTGRSKGYGFVTFREPEAARRAVEEPNPMIAGRRANCNIASLGPPRPAHPRGQGLAGDPPAGPAASGPGPTTVLPQDAAPDDGPAWGGCDGDLPFAVWWYWYPPDFQYQQALANPQLLQNYYAQLYGLTSPGTAPPYHHPYVGYMSPPAPTPRALLPPPVPAQQVAAQALVHHPTAPQIQGSFAPIPSLPHNFRLQLPPHAVSILPHNTTDLQPADQAAPAAGVTNANNISGA